MILVIDDDRAVCTLMRTVLEGQGLATRVANTASEGIGIARREPPRLILMDVHLPGVDGLLAAETLKKDPKLRDVPVLVICGYPSELIRRRMKEIGAVGLLEKPFSAQELVARVRPWMV